MAIGDGGISAEDVVVLAKVESTKGTDPTLAATDAVLTRRVVAPALDMETSAREMATSGDVPEPHHIGKYRYGFSLTWELRGSGTVDTAPDESPLLQACGLAETVNASTNVTYAPDAGNDKTATVELYLDDNHAFQGLYGVGALSMSAEVGQPVEVTAELRCLYVEPTNTASPGSESYSSQQPPTFVAGSFTFDSGAFNLRSWSLDFGAKIADKTALGGTGGYAGFKLTGFDPSGSFVVELDSEADKNWFADAIGANVGAIDMTVGDTAGNQWDIDLANVKIESVEFGEADGLAIATVGYRASDSSPGAGDWLTLVHK